MKAGKITWLRSKQLHHAEIAAIEIKDGLHYKVGMLVNETVNPLRPKGTPHPAKPYGIEIYLPITSGQDRVQKFSSKQEAKDKMQHLLDAFIKHVTAQPKEPT